MRIIAAVSVALVVAAYLIVRADDLTYLACRCRDTVVGWWLDRTLRKETRA